MIPAKLSSHMQFLLTHPAKAYLCLGTQLAQGSPWFHNKALMSLDTSASGEAHVLPQAGRQLVWTLSPIFQLLISFWKAAWSRIVLLPSSPYQAWDFQFQKCLDTIWDMKLQTSLTSRLKHCLHKAGGPWPNGWEHREKVWDWIPGLQGPATPQLKYPRRCFIIGSVY